MKKKWFVEWIEKPLPSLPSFLYFNADHTAQILAPGLNTFALSATLTSDTYMQRVIADESCSTVAAVIKIRTLYLTLVWQPVNSKT